MTYVVHVHVVVGKVITLINGRWPLHYKGDYEVITRMKQTQIDFVKTKKKLYNTKLRLLL